MRILGYVDRTNKSTRGSDWVHVVIIKEKRALLKRIFGRLWKFSPVQNVFV